MKTDEEVLQDETLYILATLIAQYTNPHLFPFDLAKVPEVELAAELTSLKKTMEEIIG